MKLKLENIVDVTVSGEGVGAVMRKVLVVVVTTFVVGVAVVVPVSVVVSVENCVEREVTVTGSTLG